MSMMAACGAGPAARATGGACTLALAVALSGCTTADGPQKPAETSGAAQPALTATLYQSRMDVDDRQVQVKVRNAGPQDVVVEHLTLRSSTFETPMAYRRRGSLVRAGRAVDMPVVLSDPVCAGVSGRHTAQVDYRLGDGTTGTVELAAADDRGQVAGLHAAECFALEVAEVATLSVHEAPLVVPRDGLLTAELVVDVEATGTGRGSLRLLHMGATTLLQHVDPVTLSRLPDGMALDLTAPDSGRRSFTATLVPGRCDAHAIAEDKQGTRFRVSVDLDGRQGQVALSAPGPVRVALYRFVREACASAGTSGG